MELMLQDGCYEPSNKDPTTRTQNEANKLIDTLISANIITVPKGKSLKKHNSTLYGLRKTHKPEFALRPVVACRDSPTYNLARFLHTLLTPINSTSQYSIKNSFHLIGLLQDYTIPPNHMLVSLDVRSLYTSIPYELVTEVIHKNWRYYECYINLPRNQLITIIEFIYKNSYFTFNKNTYRQVKGMAMGNPASPSLAGLVMEHIITTALKKLPFQVSFLKLYVDDILAVIPNGTENLVLDTFNSINSDVQFTIELEKNNSISFLDVLVTRFNNNLAWDWFRKPTTSDQILSFCSNHPLKQKRAIIHNFLHRIHNLSHSANVSKNIQIMVNLLKLNHYPKHFIKGQILKYNNRQNTKTLDQQKNKVQYVKFPFIRNLTRKIADVIQTDTVKLALYKINTTKILYNKMKDPVPDHLQSSLVYSIQCISCNKSYIGQTKQYIKKRIAQHKNDCRITNLNKQNKTALAEHHFNTGHIFDFDGYSIVDRETNLFKRNVSEMIHIKLNNCVNLRSDTAGLSAAYAGVLSKWRADTAHH